MWLKVVAFVVALASLTINFGLIDLVDGFTGYVDEARNQVLDVGWGAVFGVVLPLGLLTQLRRPERRIAGIQQTAVVAFALALAGAAGGARWYLALAVGIAVACGVLLALHPARQTFLDRGRHLEPVMLALAAVSAVPSLVYAWRMASAQRRELPPADAVSNGLHHWTVVAALALVVLLLVLLAAARTSGWANPRDQRLDRNRVVGDLLPARASRGRGQRRTRVGVGSPRLGCRHPGGGRPA